MNLHRAKLGARVDFDRIVMGVRVANRIKIVKMSVDSKLS
jgi:hypothetical protein